MTFRSSRSKRSESALSLERLSPTRDKEPSLASFPPGLLRRIEISALEQLEIDLDELLGELPKPFEIVEVTSNYLSEPRWEIVGSCLSDAERNGEVVLWRSDKLTHLCSDKLSHRLTA